MKINHQKIVQNPRLRYLYLFRQFLFGLTLLTIGYWFITMSSIGKYHVYVDDAQVSFVTDERFVSVALDTSFINGSMQNFKADDFIKLVNLLKPLTPAYLRIGGNAADVAYFNKTGPTNSFTINTDDIEKLSRLLEPIGLRLLFSCNAMQRKKGGWDESNTIEFLKYAENYFRPFDLQLGNEPNSFFHKFNYSLSPEQLGRDFIKFRSIISDLPYYHSSLLVGPDVTRPKDFGDPSIPFLDKFLKIAVGFIDAVTWHQYYVNSRNTSLQDFIDPDIMTRLELQIAEVSDKVRQYSRHIPIWLTETASAYGGGAPDLSNRYASTFLYLDKLGVAANMGISIVMKQSFYQSYYAMIDKEFNPLPNFWIAYFHKKLVSKEVFLLRSKDSDARIRLYSHKAKNNVRCFKNPAYSANLIIFGINLHKYAVSVKVMTKKQRSLCGTYIFSAEDGDLQSKSILLNGKKLTWNHSDPYHADRISREYVSFDGTGQIPAYSSVFFILT